MSTTSKPAGGIKGFLQKTGQLGIWTYEKGTTVVQWTYRYGGQAAFILATTSMVVLMPLLFEITREAQLIETERLEANDLRSKGYADRQLKEMGFSDTVLHAPSVSTMTVGSK
uniref:Mitochondrial import receptor subunit TOM22 homolog n=1 Tax=Amphora coffeiformis TaxID=265554 RepID=A0A7S3LEZ8_9STRA|mmetsp:Transcript_7705/g.14642  ORF Transcript_7705/g.14642 Transcript_7705/m.14642 type:complete len:113 (-) Transcript_7705:79-417(-)